MMIQIPTTRDAIQRMNDVKPEEKELWLMVMHVASENPELLIKTLDIVEMKRKERENTSK